MLPAFLSDVRLVTGEVPSHLPDVMTRGSLFEASRKEVLLEVPDLARLLIRRDEIVIAPLAPHTDEALGPFLRRTPLMVLMLLRGGFALSASAVAGPDGAVLMIGSTGTGKSSLAAALLHRGLRLLADDAAPLQIDETGGVRVLPVWPELLVWPDALRALCGGIPAWLTRRAGEFPYHDVAPERFCGHAMPLKKAYFLMSDTPDEAPTQARGIAKLLNGTLAPYQGELALTLADPKAVLQLYGALPGRTEMVKLAKSDFTELDALAGRIMQDCGWPSLT